MHNIYFSESPTQEDKTKEKQENDQYKIQDVASSVGEGSGSNGRGALVDVLFLKVMGVYYDSLNSTDTFYTVIL